MRKLPLRLTVTALLLALSSVHAARVTGVSTIRVTTTSSGVLQIAEVVALDADGVDVALAGTATTNSSSLGFGSLEANAINGITDGGCDASGCTPDETSPEAGHGIYHSLFGFTQFFEVHFNAPTDIFALSIFGRRDCCSERDVYDVLLLDEGDAVLFFGSEQSADNPLHEAVIISAVPLPAALLTFGASILGLMGVVKRRPDNGIRGHPGHP
ncbi:MAG: hypothetical protein O3C28_13995 [Proteobacteria bacterium]|nr:hypothetical protein [Pseudomonadota bacterium]